MLLAGGAGTRLFPTTQALSKHLIPIFDKPLIYYSFSTLMLAGCRDIAIVCQTRDEPAYRAVLGDGSNFGTTIRYIIQDEPLGIVHALKLLPDFLSGRSFALALGDNFFFGSHFSGFLEKLVSSSQGARIALKEVPDPERFGVAWLSDDHRIDRLEEKPKNPSSNLAITGLYVFDERASTFAATQTLSARGEMEIVELLNSYLRLGSLEAQTLPRGTVWQDTGTAEGLLAASNFVSSFQSLTGQLIGSPHEIAWRRQWITSDDLVLSSRQFSNAYGDSLRGLLR